MIIELINIGDELLIGQTVNTNASWMGATLAAHGVAVSRSTTISDTADEIRRQLDESLERANVVLITGGLGPTKDDITKVVLCQYFGGNLVMHEETLKRNTEYFESRGRVMLESNIQQAMVPDVCQVLTNHAGTAPGMWFEMGGKIVVSMPGVPYEMQPMMTGEVIPRLSERFHFNGFVQRSILTTGIGESFLAEIIKEWETKLRADGLGLAYLPSPGLVRLRVSSYDGEMDKVERYVGELKELVAEYYFGDENDSLAAVVARLLIEGKKTIGTVESCTTGSLAAELTKIPGSSAYFEGSLLTYSNRLKHELLGVPYTLLEELGAVSQECVEWMAVEGRKKLGVDYCLSTSGIAGPDGGTPDKPVGTVWIAVAFEGGVLSKKFQFGGLRHVNVNLSVQAALNLLRKKMMNKF
jgi:nicotinamide-nucleotide amidase